MRGCLCNDVRPSWFGFNAGSALAANGAPAQAVVNMFIAVSAGMVGWAFAEFARHKRMSTIGIASGVVAAMVAITPAAGFADSSAVPAPPGETQDFIDGVFFGGGVLLWNQVLSIAVVTIYSFAVTWIIATAIKSTMGIRVSAEVEMAGIDVSDRGEAAYQLN